MTAVNKIVYLTKEQYNTLYTTGHITISGITYNYDINNLYIVENFTDAEMSDNSENVVQNKVIKAYVDGKTVWDTEISDTSENAVQNKVIKAYIDDRFIVDMTMDPTSHHAVSSKAIAEYIESEIVDVLNKDF